MTLEHYGFVPGSFKPFLKTQPRKVYEQTVFQGQPFKVDETHKHTFKLIRENPHKEICQCGYVKFTK